MDQSDNHSQLVRPQNTYKRFKRYVIRRLQRLGGRSATPSTNVSITEDQPLFPGEQERRHFDTANTRTRGSHSQDHNASHRHDLHRSETASAEDYNPESAANHVATQFKGAHGFNITGNPTLINAGTNKGEINVTNVNNYGGIHGLEKMQNSISFDAQFDSRVQDPEHQCHPGTRETVLGQMRDWIDDLDATEPIFWLCGPAGAGKSAIARTLALSYDRPKVAATFFFSGSDGSRNDGNLLFPTLAYQLSISIPAIKDLVAKSLNERPDLSMTAIETQFEELIARPLKALNVAALPAPAIVIIDGVDECTDERLQRRFLILICTAVRDNRIPLRFIISSRREAHIENTINQTRCPRIRLDLSDLNADFDIETYLTDKFFDIASSQELDPTVWPGSHKIKELVRRASGQFAYASLVIRNIGDEDCSAETQLDIILGLRPPATTLPFKHLDELYLNVLERHPDRAFLTTFLTLFVAFLPLRFFNLLQQDYSLLMNMTEKEFHIKLRRLHSVFKFKPDIGVHHLSFIEFLQDSSRSDQYHIAEEVAARRYLELITESLVCYGSRMIEDPHNRHGFHHFRPEFGMIVHAIPLKVVLAVEGWQEVLQPLLIIWNKLLNSPNLSANSNSLSCSECTGFQIIRYLMFNVMFSEESFNHIAPSSMLNTQKTPRPMTFSLLLVPESEGNTVEKDLSGCLSSLLAHRRAESELSTIVDLLLLLLCFDPTETAKNICSVSDALTVVYLIDSLTTGNYFISLYGPDAIRRAFQLALEIYVRVPILPLSLLCNGYTDVNIYSDHGDWERSFYSDIAVWRTPFTNASRILGRNCIIPVLWIYDAVDVESGVENVCLGNSFVTNRHLISNLRGRLSSILNLAKFFQDFHLGDIVLHHEIDPVSEFQHLKFPAKICFWGVSTSYVKETPHLDDTDKARLTFEANVLIFGRLFYCLYFDAFEPFDDHVLYDGDMVLNRPLETKMDEDAWQIIQRCCAEDPKNRPTINEVVQEINVTIAGSKSTSMQPLYSVPTAHLNAISNGLVCVFEDVAVYTYNYN